ncbi:hypothetical protein Vi05172_g633 [Venturia inaequalis]|nr:hypothetical protein Vi05172_g633 [Venturia inaequalis]
MPPIGVLGMVSQFQVLGIKVNMSMNMKIENQTKAKSDSQLSSGCLRTPDGRRYDLLPGSPTYQRRGS